METNANPRSVTTNPWGRMLLMVLTSVALCSTPVAAQHAGRLPPEPWPAELGAAFELYYADEFLEVQRLCQQLGSATRDPRLRREATALAAMATMRLPGRSNRIDGRARLAQLAEADASLLTRPECQLAYGIAQTSLSATATALYHLNQATKTFAARKQTDRLAETLVALAEAWARHGEWELTVPEMDVPRPENRAEADRVRAERISELRQRAAELPGRETDVARIELILARHLLSTEDGVADGSAMLEALAGRAEVTKTTARACLTLAEHYEAAGRWADASALYARVRTADLGELSHQARQRRRAIQRPQLILDVPGQVSIGQRVEVKLAARNLAAVTLEVRRVDLAGWLEQRHGRLAPGTLPTTGALVAVRDLTPRIATEHDWWHAEMLDEPLTFEAPVGAVVVLAHATDDAGNAVVTKRLVLAGDLQAAVFIGGRHAAIWATRGGQHATAADQTEYEARFWMHGSFVPTKPRFIDGTTVFPLPPEARMLRDKRWVCLVRADDEITLCHGTLPITSDLRRKPAVILVGGPPEARVGEQIHVFGRLLGGSFDATAGQPTQTVELTLLDALDNALDTTTLAVSNAGTFFTRLPITATMANKTLRVAARLDGQTLENVFSALNVRVARADATPLRLSCNLPPWAPPTADTIAGQIEAAYPWGTPASAVYAGTRIQAMRLPTMDPKHAPLYSQAFGRNLRLNSEGKCDYTQPLSAFDLPDGPLAIGLWTEAAGWDGRRCQGSAEMLIGPEPIHLWLRGETDSPRVGEPFHISVNWFDPTGRAAGPRPTLAVWRDGAPLADLQLLPAVSGLRSETWRPTAPGSHELVASLPRIDGKPLTTRDTIQVAARDESDPPDLSPLRCEARFVLRDNRPHVHVRLDGQRRQPLLLLLEAGGPLAARQLPLLDGPTDVFIPLPDRFPAETRLVLATLAQSGIQIVSVMDVRPADDDALTLSLAGTSHAAPGETIELAATCQRGQKPVHDAILTARLVDVLNSGGVPWQPGKGRSDLMLLPGGIQFVSSATVDSSTDADVIIETRELSPQLARAFFGNPTLWIDSQAAGNEPTSFTVPLPTKPGLYRLVIAAQTPDGAFAYETLDLDTRHGLQLAADVPEQLTLGDRGTAVLTITNATLTSVQARVFFDGGPGLHMEEWLARGQNIQSAQSDNKNSLQLTLAPAGTAVLRARVEAAQPGSAVAAFIVETEQGERRATAPYRIHAVHAAPDDALREPVVIRRRLFLLEKDEGPQEDAFEETGLPRDRQPQWIRIEIEPGEYIAPGRSVLVQEEFSLARPLTRVRWEQRLPGNCHTHTGDWSDFQQIGAQRELWLDSLTYGSARLTADQRQIHEYVIVPVRPGACRFPPPTVRAEDTPVRVEIQPSAPRVLVADSN